LSNIVFNAALYKNLSYDPRRDFTPVCLINKFAYVLVARGDLPYRSVSEVVAAARRTPNVLTIAAPGVGSAPQILGAAVMKAANAQLVEVPYKGVQAPLTDMLGGRIDLMFVSQAAAMPYIREGRIKALAISDVQRSKSLPDVPTLVQAGINVSLAAWLGLFAPSRTEPETLDFLKAQSRASLPAIKTRLEAIETESIDLSPQATEVYIHQQYDRWTALIRNIGLTLD
jgi:tripartite-type tricarboxylate transporter receptor subunit TctC